ncbi:hypothetical protein M9H77_23001 [Catharanthus roseus]|uniref:Uncharacterized protein n=1 Tax=Catharanthus roseus TaxID=4058 RepID=A0ACC0AUS0_CATRO|nr:hypothetical protein M9H77_23001 [Catharanthus roseus]
MEEVPAHVHPGPIVPDVLTRQHEHRSGLIWSGDHETCFTDLQCRHFGRNLFQSYSTAPRRGSLSHTTDLGVVTYPVLRPQLMTDIQDDPLAPLGAICMNNDNEMRYLWTIAPNLAMDGIHILVEFIQIQQQTISTTHTLVQTINMTEYEIAITHMISNEPSMLYMIVTDDDAKIDHLDEENVPSSQSELDNNAEEEDLQTPVILVTENTVTQWESSQWYSSARYNYIQSGAFLDMGSGSPIDDLVEFGTLRLFDWNDSMTDIQLSMRFVDKVQAISAV